MLTYSDINRWWFIHIKIKICYWCAENGNLGNNVLIIRTVDSCNIAHNSEGKKSKTMAFAKWHVLLLFIIVVLINVISAWVWYSFWKTIQNNNGQKCVMILWHYIFLKTVEQQVTTIICQCSNISRKSNIKVLFRKLQLEIGHNQDIKTIEKDDRKRRTIRFQ